MKHIFKSFHRVIFIIFAILVFSTTNSYAYSDETLKLLNNVDIKLDELSNAIRNDTIGWLDLEILTSRRTNKYQKEYIKLNATLTPIITERANLVRDRVTKLQTMGDSVANLPNLLSESMTIAIYQDKLNHIEFLLLSRQSTISSKLSIWIAILFSLLSIKMSKKHTHEEKAKSVKNDSLSEIPVINNALSVPLYDENIKKEKAGPIKNDSVPKIPTTKKLLNETLDDKNIKNKSLNNSPQAETVESNLDRLTEKSIILPTNNRKQHGKQQSYKRKKNKE